MVNTRSATGPQSAEATGAQGPEGMEMDNPQGRGESVTSNTPADDNPEETVEQRYNRMVEQVRRKRMEESIEALEAELAGDTHAPRMEIAGLPIREKRAASSGPSGQPMAQLPRLAKPPTFRGKNLKDAAEYEMGWKIHLQASRPMSEPDQISYAATYLDDRARAA